jgi:hypothetical protein
VARVVALFALFATAAIVLTWPVATRMETAVIGALDSPALATEFMLQRHTMDKVEHGGLSRFFEMNLLQFPQVDDLAYHAGIPLHLGLYPPLRVVFGPVGALNAFILLMLVVNGLTCCWFLMRRGVDWRLSVVGGLWFMASAYFMVKLHLGFPVKLFFFWSVLYTDALLRLRETKRWSYGGLAGLYLVGSFLGYPQYGVYLVGLTGIVAAVDAVRRTPRSVWAGYALVGVSFLAVASLFLAVTGVHHDPRGGMHAPPIDTLPSLDLGSFWRSFPLVDAPGLHRPLPLGISPILVLLFVGSWGTRSRELRVLRLCAVVLLVGALGPVLHFGGAPVRVGAGFVKLPFALAMWLDPTSIRLGFPIRILPLALLCLLPVALSGLQRRVSARWGRRGVLVAAVVLAAGLFVETALTVPELYRGLVTDASTPHYIQALARGEGGVLHLPIRDRPPACLPPFDRWSGQRRPEDAPGLCSQSPSPHRYTLATGLSGRPQMNPLRPSAGLESWLARNPLRDTPIDGEALAGWLEELRGEGITNIAVHREWMFTSPDTDTETDRALRSALGSPIRDLEQRVDLYSVPVTSLP